jgi:hypothetical protein
MRAGLVILLFLTSAALPAMDTYTWVDENNERHWSDQPHPGADKIELTPQNGYRAPPLPAARSVTRAPATAAGPAYESCAIAQPTADQVYFDVDAVTISVQLAPGRRGGDVISVTVDGSGVAPASAGGTDFTVTPIDRGTHVAAATVRDASGHTLCTAAAVTFHVRQRSVARPR